jgi:hypothetical protein
MAKVSPTSFLSLPGYAGVSETYLTLWESKKVQTLKRSTVQRAGKALRNYARVFPIGQPQTCLWRGEWAWVLGQPGQAQKWWTTGLTAAKKLNMPYSEGLLHYQIGRRLPVADSERARHLARACRILSRLGATYDLERAKEALRCTTPN